VFFRGFSDLQEPSKVVQPRKTPEPLISPGFELNTLFSKSVNETAHFDEMNDV
jgi:hypothetical protein